MTLGKYVFTVLLTYKVKPTTAGHPGLILNAVQKTDKENYMASRCFMQKMNMKLLIKNK